MKKPYTLTAALLFLGGAITGGLGSKLFLEADRPQAANGTAAALPPQAAPHTEDLSSALRELAQTLGSLQNRLELRQPSTEALEPTRRAALGDDPTSLADPALARALRQLAQAIERMPRGAEDARVSTSNLLVSASHKSQFEAFGSNPLLAARMVEGDEIIWERAYAAHLQKHMFWSYEDLLSAYGRPDEIYIHDQGTEWYYRVRVHEGYKEEFSFNFHNGLLISVSYEFDEI